jgi:chromosome partitioning protein
MKGPTRIVAVANQKGGVGKTTTAINLAASLAHWGQETLLIDLDPQANSSSGLGIGGASLSRHIYHVLLDEMPLEDTLQKTSLEWLDLVPSHADLYGVEVELVGLDHRELRLKKALESFDRSYKYVIIDCPPALSLLTLNAFAAAHAVLIPMQCEYYALEGLSLLLKTIERIRGSINTTLELEGILVTMYDPRTNLTQQVLGDLRHHFGDKVFKTMVPRNVRLAEAPSFGKPVISHDKNSTGSLAYLEVAKEFIQRQGGLVGATEDPFVSCNS